MVNIVSLISGLHTIIMTCIFMIGTVMTTSLSIPRGSRYPRIRDLGLGEKKLEYRFWIIILLLGTWTLRVE